MTLPAGSGAERKEMQRRAGRVHIPSILNFARGIAHAMALPGDRVFARNTVISVTLAEICHFLSNTKGNTAVIRYPL
jgi:hypothetical protein